MKKLHFYAVTMCCVLLLSTTWGFAQTWMNKYDVSPQLSGGWKEVSKVIKTSSNDFLSVGFGRDLTFNDDRIILSKFDASGASLWNRNYGWTGPHGYQMRGVDLAESPDPTHEIVIVGSIQQNAGPQQNLIMKMNSAGTVMWENHWGSFQTRAVIFTTDPSSPNNIVAVSKELRGGVSNVAIHLINKGSGAFIRSAVIPNSLNEEPVDVMEDPIRGGYWILSNVPGPSPQMFIHFVSYGFTIHSGDVITVSPAGQYIEGVQLALDQPNLFILGNMLNAPGGAIRARRPTLIKIDASTWTITATRTVQGPFVTPTTPSLGTDLVLTYQPGNDGILVSGYDVQGGILKPWTWRTDRFFGPANFNDHSNPVQPGGVKYSSVCATGSAGFYMVAGMDGSPFNLVLSRVNNTGGVDCSIPLPVVQETPGFIFGMLNAINSYTVIAQHRAVPTVNFSWNDVQFCGCPQPTPKNNFIYAVNGTFDPNGWNGGDYHYGSGESYMFVTDQSTGSNTAMLISIDQNGQRNFIQRYSSLFGALEGADVKRAANGDFIMTGFAGSTKRLFIMRTNNAGNVIWSNYYPGTLTAANPRITETRNGDIVVVAVTDINNSGASTENLLQIRVDASGSPIYYRDQNINIGGVTRHYFYVTGITPTSDDGYAISGTSGHSWDFMGAYVFKFDANGILPYVGNLDWQYLFVANTPGGCHDLNNPSCRAYAVFYDVKELPGGNLVAVGFTSDHSQYGTGATFVDGLLLELDAAGGYVNHKQYQESSSGLQTIFHGVNYNAAGNTYIITGYTHDPGSVSSKQLFVQLDPTSLSVLSGPFSYGAGNANFGFRVYEGSNANFLMMGVSNDAGPVLPTVSSVDLNGMLGCEKLFSFNESVPGYSSPLLGMGPYFIESPILLPISQDQPCHDILDFCMSSRLVSNPTGVKSIDNSNAASALSVYPNPAGNYINIPVTAEGTTSITLCIYDIQGRMLMEYATTLVAGKQLSDVDISRLDHGTYFIRLKDDRNTVYPVLKFVKD